MINPKELRIGNIVQFEQSGKTEMIPVDQLIWRKGNLVIECAGDEIFANSEDDELEGVLLTPEILEQCGFENKCQLTDYCFIKGEIMIGGWKRSFYPSVWSESGLEAYGKELKYLHQLQNLYFALTGEELEITL